ncbi:glutamine-hydrolyzing carbamoyl-phosphate synthase small subunit [Fimbriimonas ginsengisoli]|uniref:Carbamoyl phosphate synthase small chain n=1 Tax=Fimbriimonas ginsengisoli Gsoil 348 TaxID=661478 RepID=A0A068NWQ9_FIMGI|nr:glutamine-hydrolyzing carbamoyl-phosphate synthase small subunit [Fimbriimonas ginsengisoli]AIE87881.1 carbamoyl-phosphate synthase, small subunit [Fimbriimonas ginsengisoli Gsoil 348]
MKRYLLLSDGTVFEGKPLGASGTTVGEVVFNTGMTGYQEILTDPSYAGQIVLLTYPLIGNYGINEDDFESDRIQPTGLVVREACDVPSNWRATKSIHQLLLERGTVSIQGLDTRLITKRIRSAGVTMGAICDDLDAGKEALAAAQGYDETDFVYGVSTNAPYKWGREGREGMGETDEAGRVRLAVLDCGLKFNILRRFYKSGCRPIIFPATTSAEEILSWKPDGILLSPGPGDPRRLGPVVETVKGLLGKRPMFGICLGNQLLCHAIGGETYKLKFGHRGSNHPVKDLLTGKVTITSQNHGYAVDPVSLEGTGAEVTQLNLNDGTVEGIRIKDLDANSIQYHPEAAPGPWDSRPYFSEFVERMRAVRS